MIPPPGDIILVSLPTAGGGSPKLRPALVVCHLPGPTQSLLLAAVSSSGSVPIADWDISLLSESEGFDATGLHRTSTIRLSYLYAATSGEPLGSIGAVAPETLRLASERLASRIAHRA